MIKILEKIKKSRKKYEQELKKIKTEEQWDSFLNKWLNYKKWKKKNYKEISKELRKRKSRKLDGYVWYPVSHPYKIPAELDYEYEKALEARLKQLEPRRYKDLYSREEGRECAYCYMYVESIKPKVCPFCKRKLFFINIGDD